jgi:hypothetical protein
VRALAFDPSFRFLFALGLASTSAACVLDWASLRSDGGVAPTEDAADTGEDAGSGDGEPGDGGDEKLPCKEESLVINEVQTGGPGGTADEFVEIHNPTSCDFKLEGYTLRYSSSNGSSPFAVWTGSAADGIGPGTYVVVGGTGFPGMAQPGQQGDRLRRLRHCRRRQSPRPPARRQGGTSARERAVHCANARRQGHRDERGGLRDHVDPDAEREELVPRRGR